MIESFTCEPSLSIYIDWHFVAWSQVLADRDSWSMRCPCIQRMVVNLVNVRPLKLQEFLNMIWHVLFLEFKEMVTPGLASWLSSGKGCDRWLVIGDWRSKRKGRLAINSVPHSANYELLAAENTRSPRQPTPNWGLEPNTGSRLPSKLLGPEGLPP